MRLLGLAAAAAMLLIALSPATTSLAAFVNIVQPSDGWTVSTASSGYACSLPPTQSPPNPPCGYKVITNVDTYAPPPREELWVNGSLYATIVWPTVTFVWGILGFSNGGYNLTVRAYSQDNVTFGSSTVVVTLQNPDAAPPVVAFISPANGSSISGTATLSLSVSDDPKTSNGISQVTAYLQGIGAVGTSTACSSSCTVSGGTYDLAVNTHVYAPGDYQMYAVAFDKQNNIEISPTISVTIMAVTTTTTSSTTTTTSSTRTANVTTSAGTSTSVTSTSSTSSNSSEAALRPQGNSLVLLASAGVVAILVIAALLLWRSRRP